MGSVGPLFLAIGLPAATRDLLAGVISRSTDGRPLPGRPAPPDNWHITVRYFGRMDEVTGDRLLAELDQTELGDRFDLELLGVGAFPNPRRATVLWIGVGGGAGRVVELNAAAEEAAVAVGLEPEGRPYRPHLTLSRLRPDRDLRAVMSELAVPAVRFTVSELTLFRSHVGRATWYEPVERFVLD